MKVRGALLVFSVIGLGLASLGSTCVTPKNPSTTTPPTVTFKVKGADGQYAVATTSMNLPSSTPSLDLMCIVSDSAGVQSVGLQFAVNGTNCNIGGGQFSGGGFQLAPPLPAPLSQTLTGNADGGVLNELPMLATIHGPFSCSFGGGAPSAGTGAPLGDSIVVICQGSNWSSSPSAGQAQATLTLNLQ
jgi:hypothetical protein